MTTVLENVLTLTGPFTIIVSIILNTLISVLGIIPSFIITAAISPFLDLKLVCLFLLLGSVGAGFSFWLYRKRINTFNPKILRNHKSLKLQITKGWEFTWQTSSALLIEAYSVKQVLESTNNVKSFLAIIDLFILVV